MPTESNVLAPRKPNARSRLTNHSDILANIDGRSATARRYRDIVAAILSDQGGADLCSESRVQLVRRFAAQAVQAEAMEARLARGEAIDLQEHALISSTLVRLASRIGIERRPCEPQSLAQYLASRTTEMAADSLEDEPATTLAPDDGTPAGEASP